MASPAQQAAPLIDSAARRRAAASATRVTRAGH